MYYSGYQLTKNNSAKYREFTKIPSTFYNTLYAFFIYNKYYNIYNNIKHYHMHDDSINYYKLFNCRDLYRIYSYIYMI